MATKVSKPFPVLHPGSTNAKMNTVYAALVVMRLMSKKLGIADGIKAGLQSLLTSYPEANLPAHLHSMSMPTDWDHDTLWT